MTFMSNGQKYFSGTKKWIKTETEKPISDLWWSQSVCLKNKKITKIGKKEEGERQWERDREK